MSAEATQIDDDWVPSTSTTNATDIPLGYKRTEIGVIPEDWELSRIDVHSSIKTGSKNTQDKQDDGAYPFFVRSQVVERINTYSFDGEAVLTAGDGVGTGKVFHYVNGRFDVHQRVYRIADFTDRLVGRYFFYQFSTCFYDRIMSMTAKSSVDSVRMEMIGGMVIPLPSPAEQHAIAEALSDVDRLLGALESLIAKKRAIKQAAMQQLLTGQTRLPGFSGKWEQSTVGEEFRIQLGKMLDASKNTGVAKPYVGNAAVQWGHIDSQNLPTVPLTPNDMARFRLRSGDLLVCEGGEVGRSAIWDEPIPECYFQKAIHRLRPTGGYEPQLLMAYLQHLSANGGLSDYVTQTSIAHLPKERFETIPLPKPSISEQHAIAAVLSDMDAEIESLERRRDKTQAIKQGMMQQLLTGSVRLVEPQG